MSHLFPKLCVLTWCQSLLKAPLLFFYDLLFCFLLDGRLAIPSFSLNLFNFIQYFIYREKIRYLDSLHEGIFKLTSFFIFFWFPNKFAHIINWLIFVVLIFSFVQRFPLSMPSAVGLHSLMFGKLGERRPCLLPAPTASGRLNSR
jgi:hypothetical protein